MTAGSGRTVPSDDTSRIEATLSTQPQAVKPKAGRSLLLLAFLAGLAVAGCTYTSLRPLAAVPGSPVRQQLSGLEVSASADTWTGRPRSLPDFVLPFRVQLRNGGGTAVAVTRGDFFLLDESNRQYLPLAPSDVVAILRGTSPGARIYPSISGSISSGGWSDFGVGLGILFGGSGVESRDIFSQALPEGPVQPFAEATGYLFFPMLPAEMVSISLLYAPRDRPDHLRLQFEFHRADK